MLRPTNHTTQKHKSTREGPQHTSRNGLRVRLSKGVKLWGLLLGFALAWGTVSPLVTQGIIKESQLPAEAQAWLTNPVWQWTVTAVLTPVFVLGRALVVAALAFSISVFWTPDLDFRSWWNGALNGSFALLVGALVEAVLVRWTGNVNVVMDLSLLGSWGRVVDPFEVMMIAWMVVDVYEGCRANTSVPRSAI
jgi:hypothetical protein